MGVLEHAAATVELREDGIVEFRYRDVRVDLAQARDLVEVTRAALGGVARPTLIVLGGASVDRDARTYFARSEANRALVSRAAFVATRTVDRLVGTFFLGLNRPPFPTRVFADAESAIGWLAEG